MSKTLKDDLLAGAGAFIAVAAFVLICFLA